MRIEAAQLIPREAGVRLPLVKVVHHIRYFLGLERLGVGSRSTDSDLRIPRHAQ
jgi:hypothetical protein